MPQPRLVIGAAAFVVCVGGVYLYGKQQYREGVRATTAQFLKEDMEGARNVRETAESVLSDIGDTDPDELLRATGGLRDE